MDFQARYILIKPSSPEALEERLRAAGKEESVIQEAIKKLPTELDPAKLGELFDTTIADDDVDAAAKTLGDYIYKKGGADEDTAMKDDEEATDAKEAAMADA